MYQEIKQIVTIDIRIGGLYQAMKEVSYGMVGMEGMEGELLLAFFFYYSEGIRHLAFEHGKTSCSMTAV
jgi:hypothetical protein